MKFTVLPPEADMFQTEPQIKISKGPYSATFYPSHVNDLRDANGLDAATELMHILAYELEMGPRFKAVMWGQTPPEPLIRLTAKERATILHVIRMYRNGKDPFAKV